MRRHTPSSNERCKWNLEPVCAVSATPASVGSGCGGTNWREKKKHTQPQITPLRTNVFMARPRRCGGRSSAVRVAPPPQRSKCCGRRGTRTTDPATHVALYRRVGLTYLGSVPAAGGCVAAAALALPRTPLSGRSRPHLPTLRARARLHGDVPRPEMHRRRLHGAGEAGGSTPRLAV